MQYKVEISDLANRQYDKFVDYIYNVLMNPQAAVNLMQDFDDTIEMLERQADSLGYCNSERLRKLGFHKVHFKRHKYLLVYRIKGKIVIIEGMYHELQDYENVI
ncbi:MAG: type II toxin-antitoxin system RelE/ParE family toxin [Bacteroidales bacterium]|nr:type II toxin-antitoxin system RelE/ParE family toxin [Bacteroidales bacterium]MCM1424367.1 type II toxin-antitoxin system RelE/ParE family toxin [bacterium]